MQMPHQRRRRADARVVLGLRVGPHSVEVDAATVGSVVTAVDAVRVQHGYELEDETRAQRGGARVGCMQEEAQRAVEDVRRGSLSRVHACSEQEDRLGRRECARLVQVRVRGRLGLELGLGSGLGLGLGFGLAAKARARTPPSDSQVASPASARPGRGASATSSMLEALLTVSSSTLS